MKFAIDPLNERVGLSGDAAPPGARFHVIVGAVSCQSTLLVISLMYTNTLLRSCQLQWRQSASKIRGLSWPSVKGHATKCHYPQPTFWIENNPFIFVTDWGSNPIANKLSGKGWDCYNSFLFISIYRVWAIRLLYFGVLRDFAIVLKF